MTTENEQKPDVQDEKPVNEDMGFCFSSSIKIYDPNTQEVLVQMRGDD